MSDEIPLIADTRARLEPWRGQWPRLAREAGVSYSWLCKFAGGSIESPGTKHLQALRDVLLRTAPSEAAA